MVVYTNASSKFRQITIFDHYDYIDSPGDYHSIDVAGIKTPPTGPVKAALGFTAAGGASIQTDDLQFGVPSGTLVPLVDPCDGATNNMLDSDIGIAASNNVSADGGPALSGPVTTRSSIGNAIFPAYFFSTKIVDASNILPSGCATQTARLRFNVTSEDNTSHGNFFLSVDLPEPASLNKSITPSSIISGQTATYSFTVANTTTGATAQSGIGFTDNLPSGLRIAATPNVTITGGSGASVTAAPGGTAISVSGLSLATGATAIISVNVTNVPGQVNASCGDNPAAFTNSSANITVTGLCSNLNNLVGNVCLVVVPPSVFSISGNVLNDVNGLTDNTVNGTAINGTAVAQPGGSPIPLYASLVSGGSIVATVPVTSTGTYSFAGVSNGSYSVILTTNSAGSLTPSVPTSWTNTGENIGTAVGNDGSPNGNLSVTVSGAPITDANFGIEQLPTAGSGVNTVSNPGGTTPVPVPTNTFTNTTVSSDVTPGTVTSIRITGFPTNTTSLTINGTVYNSGNFPGGGVVVTTDGSGNPSVPILVDPTNDANPVTIPFKAIDNAGKESTNTGTAVLNFTTPALPSISGNVFNDVNGLTDNTVNGTPVNGTALPQPGGSPIPLYASLIQNNNLIATVPVTSSGTYSFPNVANGSYVVLLTTNSGGSTSASLPSSWVNTGENLGTAAGNDGSPNGNLSVSVSGGTSVTNANFGIRQAPDLTPIIYARPSTVYNTTNITVVVDVFELLSVPTSGLITVKVPKDARFALTFNQSATSVDERSVQNSAWTYQGLIGGSYTFTTTNVIAGNVGTGKLTFGMTGTLTPGATTGTLTVSSVIVGGSGGEIRIDNNNDADKIDYFQQ